MQKVNGVFRGIGYVITCGKYCKGEKSSSVKKTTPNASVKKAAGKKASQKQSAYEWAKNGTCTVVSTGWAGIKGFGKVVYANLFHTGAVLFGSYMAPGAVKLTGAGFGAGAKMVEGFCQVALPQILNDARTSFMNWRKGSAAQQPAQAPKSQRTAETEKVEQNEKTERSSRNRKTRDEQPVVDADKPAGGKKPSAKRNAAPL
ncbi:hypothetical protein [Parendozoicomonas haliclonae]|uniref:Uncharacterized protein n=1 Tax=Parendozoicomonas haliclonae TaxID=1960125 RepID=A0A1X7AHV4_9GAMM|nr:hypothetical protein [Parendozoicomonas haliclonae]SMA43613.1 hypothetical protein EHSB41UT_01635 [Parendozoicomonas haliclonae]